MIQSKDHSKNICGRALAPFVKDITCLDLTEEMLAQEKNLSEKDLFHLHREIWCILNPMSKI